MNPSLCDLSLNIKLSTYFRRLKGILPNALSQLESTRLVLLFFSTSGSNLLCDDETAVTELVEWVYSHQISPDCNGMASGGFRSMLYTKPSEDSLTHYSPYDYNHVTMVYTALTTLIILGDDLMRVDRQNVICGILSLQCTEEPGCFKSASLSPEHDMRFLFSATASCYILDGIDQLDTCAILAFIGRCLTFDGGFAQLPGLESHAGATYCALATLALLECLDHFLPLNSRVRNRNIKWLLSLQSEGFHGRYHKDDDTCYTFWVCASLKLLNHEELINRDSLLIFVSRCWDNIVGGIRKFPDPVLSPDPLHTYLCLAGLSCLKFQDHTRTNSGNSEELHIGDNQNYSSVLLGTRAAFKSLIFDDLRAIDPRLNITEVASDRLKDLHRKWRASTNRTSLP